MPVGLWSAPGISVNWGITIPIAIVVLTAMGAMMTDAFSKRKEYTALVTIGGLVVALFACLRLWGNGFHATFAPIDAPIAGQLIADNYALFLCMLFVSVGLATAWISHTWLAQRNLMHGEYYVLMLFAISGMMLMVQATELITLFVGLETFSISLYVLSAFARSKKRSEEAGLKYLLLGAFSSAFLLYGIAFIYGAMGTTNLNVIADTLAQPGALAAVGPYMLPAGIGLMLVGLGFKVAAVPFHLWTPDVYEGAPTPVTAFMSVATKAAAFGAMGRILLFAFPTASQSWQPLVASMALATMIVGNFVAVCQNNVKRMLAYSSIAHAGYVLIGIVAGDLPGILFYLLCYAVMNFGAFSVVAAMSRQGRDYDTFEDYNGLHHRNPGLALAMSVFMFSLAGIPPAVGFYGKFYLFAHAVERGYTGLVVVGVLTSVVSAWYYLRVVVAMWMREGEPGSRKLHVAPGIAIVVAACALFTVFAFLAPSRMIDAANDAGKTAVTSMTAASR
jgi:NADH-quinone oxidoreductase subunit N